MLVLRLLCVVLFIVSVRCFRFTCLPKFQKQRMNPLLALDNFVSERLTSIVRNFDALTERLADPDVANDRKQMLELSRERSSMEQTVISFQSWQKLETEKEDLATMEQTNSEQDIRDMIRGEMKDICTKQEHLESEIMLLLLPRDPNDDRNVMLEIRAATGGDEAGIWAGELVNIYRKYADSQGWKVTTLSESQADMGGIKTCILQVTGDYVYSKMKYEVLRFYCTTNPLVL